MLRRGSWESEWIMRGNLPRGIGEKDGALTNS
jgi:hypothetical protein